MFLNSILADDQAHAYRNDLKFNMSTKTVFIISSNFKYLSKKLRVLNQTVLV